ncbi:fibrinogen-like protein A [Ciona intestinalis]
MRSMFLMLVLMLVPPTFQLNQVNRGSFQKMYFSKNPKKMLNVLYNMCLVATPKYVNATAYPTDPLQPYTFNVSVIDIQRYSVLVELERTDQKSGWDEISITVVWESKMYNLPLTDCKQTHLAGLFDSGIYEVKKNGAIVEVYCDMKTDGGGWTVFQRRINGQQDFYLTWDEHRQGFGNKSGEFWMGLDNLHSFTQNGSFELRIELTNCENQTLYAKYRTFKVMDLSTNFRLLVENFSGSPGLHDSLSYHNGVPFSTKDRDNDGLSSSHPTPCANQYRAGWWYSACHTANLNGEFRPCVETPNSMTWINNTFVGFRFSEMKFRPL